MEQGRRSEPRDGAVGRRPGALLLAQLGALAGRRFGERLRPLGLEPRHVGVLRAVAAADGPSQGELGARLGLASPRMVAVVDDLEDRGLVERHRNREDRRAYAIRLTEAGRRALDAAASAGRGLDEELLGALDAEERERLLTLLDRVAESHDVGPTTMPGPPWLGGGRPPG